MSELPYDNPRPSSQPLGSTSGEVLKDNLITLDAMTTSTDETITNRKGQQRKTLVGQNADYQRAISDIESDAENRIASSLSNIGATPLDDGVWAVGKVFESYNQYLIYNGAPYKPKTSTVLPYTTVNADATIDAGVQPFSLDIDSGYTAKGETQVTGLIVYPSEFDKSASTTSPYNSAPSGTTALRDGVNDKVYMTSSIVSGEITAVDFALGTATVGGNNVTLTESSTPHGVIDFRNIISDIEDPSDAANAITISSRLNQSAISAAATNKKLVCSAGTIAVTGVINLIGIYLDFSCDLDYSSRSGHVKIGGNSSSPINPKQYIKGVTATSRDIDTYCVSIEGSRNQQVKVDYAPSMRIFAENAGNAQNNSVAYSEFTLGDVFHLDIYGDAKGATAQAGWINENVFHLRSVNNFRLGRSDIDTYIHNNNRFNGGTFETATSNIDIIGASSNVFRDLRLEGAVNDSIEFGERTKNNTIFISYASSDIGLPSPTLRYIDNGIGNQVAGVNEPAFGNMPLCDINRGTVKLDSTNYLNTNIEGILQYGVDQSPTDEPTATLLRYSGSGNKLTVESFGMIYRQDFIKIDQSGDTWISAQADGSEEVGAGIRVTVFGWDADMNPITPSIGDMEIIGQGAVAFGTFNSVNVKNTRIRVLNKSAIYVSVLVRNGSGTHTFSSVKASIRLPKTRADKTVGAETYSDEFCNFTMTGNTQPLDRTAPMFFSPLLTSVSIGAGEVSKQPFDVSSTFGKSITFGEWHLSTMPVFGIGQPTGLIFQSYLTSDNNIEVWITNASNATVALPSTTKPVIMLTPIQQTFSS